MIGRVRIVAVWGALSAMTFASFETIGLPHGASAILVIVIAGCKAVLIGREFMGLRDAHWALQTAFHVWAGAIVLALCTILLGGKA